MSLTITLKNLSTPKAIGAGVEAFEGSGSVAAVRTSEGQSIACDFVVVGVGAILRTQLAAAAGAKIENGIVVDQQLRTTLPDVHAAGDVAGMNVNVWDVNEDVQTLIRSRREINPAALRDKDTPLGVLAKQPTPADTNRASPAPQPAGSGIASPRRGRHFTPR